MISLNAQIQVRAEGLEQKGFKGLDALHIASAEWAKADRFCTCDDRLLKKAKLEIRQPTRAVSPLELIEEVDP
jgi:predicted nucleic acid-binding protein